MIVSCSQSNFHNYTRMYQISPVKTQIENYKETYICDCGCLFAWNDKLNWKILGDQNGRTKNRLLERVSY